jgi:uncharacterized protein YrzB (UPF0473 family)
MTNDESTKVTNEENEEIEDDDCYTLMDEDGNEHDFIMLALIEIEDVDYALMTPDYGSEEPPEDLELLILEYTDEGDMESFNEVGDDETYAKVEEVFASILDQESEVLEA